MKYKPLTAKINKKYFTYFPEAKEITGTWTVCKNGLCKRTVLIPEGELRAACWHCGCTCTPQDMPKK